MKRYGLVLLLAIGPLETQALAAGEPGGFNLLAVFFQMLAALAVVIGTIFLFHYASNRWLKGIASGKGGARHIRLLESRYLGPKKALVLVEVGGEYLLLANSGDSLKLVKRIDMLEEIELLDEAGHPPVAGAFQGKLEAVMGRNRGSK